MKPSFLLCARLFGIIFLTETVLGNGSKKIVLKSIQYHAGATQESANLELGTMVLFFSEPVVPIVLHKKNVSNKSIEQRIMFPQVILSDDHVKSMIESLNNKKTDGYTISFAQVRLPVPGLELVITYDQQQVFHHYETTVSSAALPGYIFRFINQVCYNDLVKKCQEKRITHTAWQKKSLVL
ncbi:hypothetical protein EKK58_04595 [Candidatus Dependentiae bacterium]|nr:MAG: hypothetical protein EKK58_04595 [Candidatus Dependentiae bacterium]